MQPVLLFPTTLGKRTKLLSESEQKMKLLNLAAWLLPAFAAAGTVLAEHSIPPQARHYVRRQQHELTRRGGGTSDLAKRVDNVKWSFYDAETGNECVHYYSILRG